MSTRPYSATRWQALTSSAFSSGASVGAAFAILFVSSGRCPPRSVPLRAGWRRCSSRLGWPLPRRGAAKMSLVLAGIAVHALAQTLLMLLKLTADPEKELASIEYWIMAVWPP